MKVEELTKILDLHNKWLKNELGGKCADLRYADLRYANLHGANLQGAYLRYANLHGANLQGAYLQDANLRYANLRYANLQGANLQDANLRYANLQGANLQGANLQDANLRYANLRYANLRYANFDSTTSYLNIQCPEVGSFIAYKKAGTHVVKLHVPSNAKRSSATSRKCRCDHAQVVEILNLDKTLADTKEVSSNYDADFIYKVGQTVSVDNFCEDRFNECAPGIHFFITFDEAAKY